jgi:hypothetical protein
MTSLGYLQGRQKYGRPQGMLWANNSGYVDENGFLIPYGEEVTSSLFDPNDVSAEKFLILTDDNRKDIAFRTERIEKRERMINGRMRSYHIADKALIETSWEMIPSRAYPANPDFNDATGKAIAALRGYEYTTDGGAGGSEILDWYRQTKGEPFFVYLAYDNYTNTGRDESSFNNLNKYNEVIEVYFADFSHSVVKRGQTNYDFWNINLTLEEV